LPRLARATCAPHAGRRRQAQCEMSIRGDRGNQSSHRDDAERPLAITVNAISPGWTDDSVLNTLPDPVQQMIREHHGSGWTPMRRLGTPLDIANAVALFCSKEAGWITGQTIAADGGMGLMDPALPLAIQQPERQPV